MIHSFSQSFLIRSFSLYLFAQLFLVVAFEPGRHRRNSKPRGSHVHTRYNCTSSTCIASHTGWRILCLASGQLTGPFRCLHISLFSCFMACHRRYGGYRRNPIDVSRRVHRQVRFSWRRKEDHMRSQDVLVRVRGMQKIELGPRTYASRLIWSPRGHDTCPHRIGIGGEPRRGRLTLLQSDLREGKL